MPEQDRKPGIAPTPIGGGSAPWRHAPDFDETDVPATFPRLAGRKGIAQLMVSMQDLFIATGPAQVEDLVAEWRDDAWDVLVADEVSIGPRLVAERLGCRWATVAVLPLYLASRRGPPGGLALAPGRTIRNRVRDAALRALVPAMSLPLRRPVARARAAAGLPPSPEVFGQAIFSADLILATGVPALDHRRTDRPARLRWVGRLEGPPSTEPALPAWWDDLRDRHVVVVSQGTFNTDPEELLRPALAGGGGWDDPRGGPPPRLRRGARALNGGRRASGTRPRSRGRVSRCSGGRPRRR